MTVNFLPMASRMIRRKTSASTLQEIFPRILRIPLTQQVNASRLIINPFHNVPPRLDLFRLFPSNIGPPHPSESASYTAFEGQCEEQT